VVASRRVFLRLVALGGGAAVASACSASPPSAAAPSTQSSPVAPVSAPVTAAKSTADLRIALASEPNTFDPHLTVGRNTQIFIANVYDGLTARDPRANLVPALATEWKVLEDHSGWQFKLRQGVKFQNGDDFNAESVKFTLDRAINPDTKSTVSSELGTIAGTDIVDASTVTVRTKQPDIMLPSRLSELYGGMLSPAYTRATDPASFGTKPIGTGPFKVTEWVKNERLVLEANPTYWRGAASVGRIVVRPILEDAARVAALQAGEVDFISNVPYQRADELGRDTNLLVKTVTTPRVFFVVIDPRQKPFDDVRVRQALNYAVDVDAIIKTLYLGHAKLLATVIDEASLGYDPTVAPYPYDPAKAQALLAEAGYPNGFSTEFDTFTGSIADHSKPAEAIVEYLRKVGVNAKLNVFEFGAFGPRRVANQVSPLHIYSLGNAYFEPAWALKWMMQDNLGMHYRNADAYAQLNKAEGTFDPEERKKLYADVQRKLKDDAGFLFLYQSDAVFAMSKRLDYEPRADETQWLYPAKLTT